MLNPAVKVNANDFAMKFATGYPYKHVCIDNFFAVEAAENILRDFPSFASTSRTNEFGLEGFKAVHERLSEISPFYAKLVEYLKSAEFHGFLEQVTGIKGLRWGGESMYGGGTHENVHNGELDPHVDFNYDDRTKEHRRLNLLIYLTKDWQSAWGGDFELHSDPRHPEANTIKRYELLFNRAVLMETNERSWHAFPRIQLPEPKRHLSRKSIALYFYTNDRPQDEVHGAHGTFYVHWPLPETFKVGAVITDAMKAEIEGLIIKRDAFLELYQKREEEMGRRLAAVEATAGLNPLLRFMQRVYHDLPINPNRKQQLRGFLYSCIPRLFAPLTSFQVWKKQR